LDGGAMFGVVPKRMWEKMNPPDENNLCTWALRCLLVESGDRKILIDCGIGNKQDAKFRSHFNPFGDISIESSLEAHGLSPNDITDVLLTHLHFDHCGGALKMEGEKIVPVFPNATYWSNQKHWDWAMTPNYREKASFLKENFVPLLEQGLLQMIPVEQDVEWLLGIKIHFLYGHTEAMMCPLLTTENGAQFLYCADLLPSVHHIGMPYVMGYDVRPLETLKEKEWLLELAYEQQVKLLLEHDPLYEYCTIQKNEKGQMVLGEKGNL
jgi:glyoxylase-like metal-dependent hydrolase (beta-lactamase superfamily II)